MKQRKLKTQLDCQEKHSGTFLFSKRDHAFIQASEGGEGGLEAHIK